MRRLEVADQPIAELAGLLKERVGLNVKPDNYASLKLAVAARLEDKAPPAADETAYVALLRSPGGDEEMRRLLPLVTVGKTSFFRDERQFRALAALFPDLLADARRAGRPVSIWSAGCATGEEPYSIAMTAAEAGASPRELELVATDLNPEAAAAAHAGIFAARRVHDGVQPRLTEKYFAPEGHKLLRVTPSLRSYLSHIETHNLNSPVYPRPHRGQGWDALFCRNVIIYFDTPTAQQVLSRFLAVLAPGGYLFLGYSESLFRLFDGFELTEVAGSFIYRKPFVPARAPASPRRAAAPMSRYTPVPVKHVQPRSVKVPPADPSQPLATVSPQEGLDAAVELLEGGQFGAARDLLEKLLAALGEGLALRLTLANVYGLLRQSDKARSCYVASLAIESLSAEAHLFYGVFLLTEGDIAEAARELSRALFLDPDLSLAHYYLGRCRERQRDVGRARLAYKNAMDAYKREPRGRRQAFLGYYPDLPEDGSAFARAAEYALAAL